MQATLRKAKSCMPQSISQGPHVPNSISSKQGIDEGGGSRHPAFSRVDDYQNRKLAIIKASIRLFNKHGFHATSIRHISQDLGLSSAAVYYYFKDKYDLLYHCYLLAVHNGLDVAVRVQQTDGTGLEKFETYIREQFKALVGNEGAAWILSDITALKPDQNEEIVRLSREVDNLVLGFIEQGSKDGSISVSNPRITEFFILGALNWVPRWYRANLELGAHELAEIFLELVFDGLRPR